MLLTDRKTSQNLKTSPIYREDAMQEPLRIRDGPDLIEIDFSDVEKYHGQHAIVGAAVAFMAMHAAFPSIYPDRHPSREEITIVTGHPGPGVRDAFEFVTRAVSRNAYRVDAERPQARWDPYSNTSFTFTISCDQGRYVDLSMKQEILPMHFFDLLDLKHRGAANHDQQQELRQLKRTLANHILGSPCAALFDVDRQDSPRE